MILNIKIEVKDKLEAYDIVSRLGLQHEILEAEFDGAKEVFDKENRPVYFLKNKIRNIAKYRSYEFRQQEKTE
jgi:hypothetical protein